MHKAQLNIRKIRIEKGMTQKTLAELTGYTDRSSIAKIESGAVDLPLQKIEVFAAALDTDVESLLGITLSDALLSSDESELLHDYQKLNDEGKHEALKQVKNLTKIDDYKS